MVRLESNGTILDLFSDEAISLDINVQNVRDIGKVYAPISKSFSLPASDRNNAFFKHYYDVNIDGGFDAYNRTPCQLYVDSEQIFSGYLELLDTVIDNDKPKQYEVLVASATPNLSKVLEGKTLDQLTLSSIGGAAYNRTQITSSWAGSLSGGDIRYGLVGRRALTNGNGVLKATSNSAGNASQPFEASDFMPYMRVREIVKGIIEENGFRYSSTWLDSDTDLSNTYLMLGRDGGLLTAFDVLNLRTIDASGSANITVTDPTSTGAGFKQLTFPSEIEDPNSDWNTTNSSYTAPANGFYSFNLEFDVSNSDELQIVAFDRADITGGCNPSTGLTCTPVSQAYWSSFGNSSTTRNVGLTFQFSNGVEYVFYVRSLNQTTVPTISNRRITTKQVPFSPTDATLSFSALLPSVPQKDFLGQIAKAYNLVFVPDKFDDKLLHIEPWVDWIASGSTFDLTPYVDQNKPINVKPTTELQARSLSFAMGEGKSYTEELFIKRFNRSEGSIELKDTGNQFADGEQDVEVDFIGTLMQKDSGSLVQWPQITDDTFQPVDYGLRLGYWNGSEDLSYDWKDTSGSVTNYPTGKIGFLPPYSSNSPSATDYSLSFAAPSVPQGLDTPLNNWFTNYWREYIQNIYDKDSRLVILEARLSSNILNSIALNDQVLYKNQYYLIQGIKYDTQTERAQFELLKAVASNPVICGLEPASYNFRGLVTFNDTVNGGTTTDATLNCCKFYGFNYSGGKCYTKFDVQTPTGFENPILNIPPTTGIGQVTGILNDDLLVPALNPTDGTVTYRTVNNIIENQYGDPVYDDSNAAILGTTTNPSVTYTSRQINFYKVGRIGYLNFSIQLTGISSGSGSVELDLSSVLPAEYEIYDDGATPPQFLGSAIYTTGSGTTAVLIPQRQSANSVLFLYTGGNFLVSDLGTGGSLYGSISYITTE